MRTKQVFEAWLLAGATLFLTVCGAFAATNQTASPIDLATALRLAGAQNLDVRIARERLNEAKGNQTSATWQFFPWLAPGASYRRHNGLIQDVAGNFLDVNKESYAPGATLAAQVDIGEALYKSLESRKLAEAAAHVVESERQRAVAAAAAAYFELARAQAAVEVAQQAVEISSNQEAQVAAAVEAGMALKGDQLRNRVQLDQNRLALRQRSEEQRIAASRLALALRLDPAVQLSAQAAELVPLSLVESNTTLHGFIAAALVRRPELRESEAYIAAAEKAREGAVYGPLIPRLDGQAFWGGLGGSHDGVSHRVEAQEDYYVGLSWRVGPGGLFDSGRRHSRAARLEITNLQAAKLRDSITADVVEAFTKWQSARDRLQTAEELLKNTEEALHLTGERKSFAIGAVLENIQAEQDWTRARNDYLKLVAELNSAAYGLLRAAGTL